MLRILAERALFLDHRDTPPSAIKLAYVTRGMPMEDDELLWQPPTDGVPPVVGKHEPGTNEPMMHYDTDGEISLPDERPGPDDGVEVSISF
jgi:hypothetical protein